MDGVVRAPSALAMTVGSPPSRTETTELVVPRSIPTARDMQSSYCFPARNRSAGLSGCAARVGTALYGCSFRRVGSSTTLVVLCDLRLTMPTADEAVKGPEPITLNFTARSNSSSPPAIPSRGRSGAECPESLDPPRSGVVLQLEGDGVQPCPWRYDATALSNEIRR